MDEVCVCVYISFSGVKLWVLYCKHVLDKRCGI